MISEQKQPDMLCFGGEDWWYHNRGHIDMQLMRRYAKNGTVVYVNSIVMQKPKFTLGHRFLEKLVRKSKSIFNGLKKTDTDFWVYSPVTLPVHHIAQARRWHGRFLKFQIQRTMDKLGMKNPLIWVACPTACDTAIELNTHSLVYQRTDRFEEYPNVDSRVIGHCDRKLKAAANLTVFVNQTLFEEESQQCRSAIYLDHGVDYDRFAYAEQDPNKPDDIKDIPSPIVGFFGGIDDHTTNMNLVREVIDLLPEMNFVFVGKASVDCGKLLGKKNVWMLGQKPYEQIPHYGKCFDVAIMPWQQNRWIHACNPIKLKEYLALGKPIVSTPFAELEKYLDVVYRCESSEEFTQKIKLALRENCSNRIAARRHKVQEASWEQKAELVLKALHQNTENPRKVIAGD